MATLAGSLSFKLSSLAIQHRVFSIPWATGRGAIFCLSERGFNSSRSPSMPVRYIPKKSKKNRLTTENDDKNRMHVANNTNPLRINLHEKHKDNNINNLRFTDAKRERNGVGGIDCNLEVTNECLVKKHVEVVLKETRSSKQEDVFQQGPAKSNKVVADSVRVVNGGGFAKEPEDSVVKVGRIRQQEDIDVVGIFQASKVVEDVKMFAEEKEEKIDRDLNAVDGLTKDLEKVIVMKRRASQQNDIDILQPPKEAESVKKLTEVKEHQNDLYVKEAEEIVVTEKKISQGKDILKGGVLKGSEALRYIKKWTEDKEENETGNARWVMDNEFIEEPKDDPDEEIEINLKKEMGVLGFDEIVQDVKKAAIVLLGKRAYTAVELKKKLQAKKFPTRIVDSIIDDFQKSGLVNDSLYAECFSRSRWSSSTWGPGRIKNALSRKGVSETNVKKAVKVVFEEDESGEDNELVLGMSKLSMDHLFVQASKQWVRRPKEKRKASIIRWLEYRGFRWNVISFIVKKLESQYSP